MTLRRAVARVGVFALSLVGLLQVGRGPDVDGHGQGLFWSVSASALGPEPARAPYLDPDLPPKQRTADLLSRMTLAEKVLQMQSTAPAIPRLGVPAYNWWNEALHGVAQGRATVFP